VNVLVTGGSGQLSSYLFEELGGKHHATGIDVVEAKHASAKGKVEIGDIRDSQVLDRVCRNADAVVHTAAQVSVQRSTENPVLDADLNVMGTIKALKAARDAGVKKFVFISSAAVYGNPVRIPIDEDHPTAPMSIYGTSKLAGEHFVRAFGSSYGMKYAIVRPFNFYSPRADPKSPYSGVITKFVENAKAGMPLKIEGSGEQTRDFLHAADVARMVRLILESDVQNVTLNCGSGHGTSINALAETVRKVSPRPTTIEHVAPRTADIRDSIAKMDRTGRMLGFRVNISLEEGLRAFFQ
jgi:UDP-glucose 4-epimerase